MFLIWKKITSSISHQQKLSSNPSILQNQFFLKKIEGGRKIVLLSCRWGHQIERPSKLMESKYYFRERILCVGGSVNGSQWGFSMEFHGKRDVKPPSRNPQFFQGHYSSPTPWSSIVTSTRHLGPRKKAHTHSIGHRSTAVQASARLKAVSKYQTPLLPLIHIAPAHIDLVVVSPGGMLRSR